MAKFDVDGSYSAKTGEARGLMPGQYKIAIQCWKQDPTDREGGKSVMPERYRFPATSGLELNVPLGSGPITFDPDVK
jgi:hypothetical protein